MRIVVNDGDHTISGNSLRREEISGGEYCRRLVFRCLYGPTPAKAILLKLRDGLTNPRNYSFWRGWTVNIFILSVCGKPSATAIAHVTVELTLFCFPSVLWLLRGDRPEPEGEDSTERSSGKGRVRDASRACKKKVILEASAIIRATFLRILQLYIKCALCILPLYFATLYFFSCNCALSSELIGPKLN